MKKLFLYISISIICISSFAQRPSFTELDYDGIKAVVSDSSSLDFYPRLMERYMANDVTLTLDDFRLLYYGYIYQSSYDPYSPAMQHNALSLYLNKDEITPEDCDKILGYANIAMIDFPFNFHLLRMAVYAHHIKGEKEEADKKMKMLNGITDAILSSGDGKSLKTAYHVIYTTHEYEIVNILGYNAEYQKLNNVWDIISLSPNKDKIPALYFNVEAMLVSYQEKVDKIKAERESPKE